MILDTSAIVAILQGEPEAGAFAALIEASPQVRISAATVLEASIVLGARRRQLLDDFLAVAAAFVEPVDTSSSTSHGARTCCTAAARDRPPD